MLLKFEDELWRKWCNVMILFFQDQNTFWNADDPDLTICFEKTILVWMPCAFLWIFLPFEMYLLRRSKSSDIPLNVYNVTKLVMFTLFDKLIIKKFNMSSFWLTIVFTSFVSRNYSKIHTKRRNYVDLFL